MTYSVCPFVSTIPIYYQSTFTRDRCHWLSYEIILPCIGRMSKMDPICNLGVYFCANYWWSPRWTRTWYGLSLQIGLDAHDSLLRWSLRRRKSLDILRVKKRVPTLILAWVNLWEVILWGGSNHCWIILEKWLGSIKWNHIFGNGLGHMLKVDLLKWMRQRLLQPSNVKEWKK